jgi:DNA primase
VTAKDWTDALNGLTVQTVGTLLGIKLPSSGMAHCPFVWHDDSTPSFEIRKGGSRWTCYGCNNHGGAIDLVMVFHGLSFPDAKRWLAEKSGLGSSSWKRGAEPTDKRPARAAVPKRREAAETPPDHQLYASFLARSPLLISGQQYLRDRALDDAIVTRFEIGQSPAAASIRELVAEFGFARVEAAGLLTKASTVNRFWSIFPTGSLLFPYLENGRVTYFQARVIDDRINGSRWRNLNHRHRRLYNADILTDSSIRRVAICEGAIDVLSSTQLGCDAIGLIGVTGWLSAAETKLLRGRQVDLLLDWDEPGEKRATTIRRELARFGVAATRKTMPRNGAKDVNDYLQQGNSRI